MLDWEAAYAKAYSMEVSQDGKTWKEVYRTQDGQRGTGDGPLRATEARWVRMTGTQRATKFGYSLWELRVFKE